jgi:hypothetical protein
MGMERAKLRNRTISNVDVSAHRKRWFHTIRKAKRLSLESFLQEGKEEDIWKAISGKQAQLPMPQLVSTTGQVANNEEEKTNLLTGISFPDDRSQTIIPTLPPINIDQDPLELWTTEDTARILGTRSIWCAQGADGLTYSAYGSN